jgi:hypothetical protein
VRLALLALSLVLAGGGCGFGSPSGHGEATLWVTRDRGAHLLLVRKVRAGVSAMDALAGVAKVRTRYGGRFVESIDGLAGNLARRDWFYFVNGYEADRSAADYTLHAGDVEWWDYRSWAREMHVPIVVGAFPEPFLHGFDGKRREAAVVFDSPSARDAAQAIARAIHARPVRPARLAQANVLFVSSRPVAFSATTAGAGQPVRFTIAAADVPRILRDPKLYLRRYSGLSR